MNSIIENNLGGSNSIQSLTFIWLAIFEDGSKIEQFNSDETENKFQLIKNKFDKLEHFILFNKENVFTVDLKLGIIIYNDYSIKSIDIPKKENIRLIYFRRHRVEVGTIDLKKQFHSIEYHLGFQYLKNGNNRQLVLVIDSKGNFVVTGE